MKLFECEGCGNAIYFENTHCEGCGHKLGFRSDQGTLVALEDDGAGLLRPLGEDQPFRNCANQEAGGCNWLVPADRSEEFCAACRLNNTVPDLSNPEHRQLWRVLETGKRRLVYSLLRLGLPLRNKADDEEHGLAFDFLADEVTGFREGPKVLTGHASGLITINIAEADPAKREEFRQTMAEPYRTVLGHFRHEVGHYYWELMVRDRPALADCRALFGDETQDYGASLERHYEQGPRADWPAHYVSAYASSHPWEDWAETWAHYLHMVDSLETAYAFGLRIRPKAGPTPDLATAANFDPYREPGFERIQETWLPLTFAVNSLNRSMGQADLYPFVLSQPATDKIAFVHRLIREAETG
ncbi:MAG: putative zinc-binding peptidase [Sneathiellaceae bacterium]